MHESLGSLRRIGNSIKQLSTLAMRSNKIWILPVILMLIIAALITVSASVAPVPLFLYPLI